jgi:ADP-heptose:LPS heptosyltransferase/SAM-dependent methyltransferase
MEKIVLVNDLSPGDILLMSIALRSLHKAHPGKYISDVRSPCNEIFMNNPYVTHINVPDPAAANKAIEDLKKDETHPPIILGDTKYIISHYPLIHVSGMTGLPFADGHRMFLAKQLGIDIPRTGMKPDIFFSPMELSLPRMVKGKYWIINAGIKNDYTLKWYAYYQEVVDMLKDKIQFVQVGQVAPGHNHPPLNGVIDLRGKTTLRQLFLLSHYSEGSICAVSLQMVVMAALSKPCVVIAGAREGTRWQLNPDHRFLYMTGAMKCATYDGCWRSKKEECDFKSRSGEPMCMELIRPEDVARAVELYYLGGRLSYDVTKPVILDIQGKKGEEKMEEIKFIKEEMEKKEAGPVILDLNAKETGKAVAKNLLEEIQTKMGELDESYHQPQTDSAIFNILRILKKLLPEDKYYEAYQWHYNKNKDKFMDTYHFAWYIGSVVRPKRVLEIGCRTGISICQLLSAYTDYSGLELVLLCDTFTEAPAVGPDIVFNALKYLNIPVDKVQFMIGDSISQIPAYAQKFPDSKFDYILVDGCHDKDYARQDLFNCSKIIDIGGYIVFDDLTPDGCSLQDVWDEFKQAHADEFIFMENHDGKGIGVARKI